MSAPTARRLAWSLCGVSVTLAALSLALFALNWASRDAEERWVAALVPFAVGAFAAVGAVVASGRPKNAVGWIFCAFGPLVGIGTCAAYYAEYTFRFHRGWLPGADYAAWVGTWIFVVSSVLALVFLPLVFPDGRLPSSRWRPVALLGTVGGSLVLVGTMFAPGPLSDFDPPVVNPLGVEGTLGHVLEALGEYAGALVIVAIPAAVVAMVVRFRRSRGDERQQLKWFVYAGVVTSPFWLGSIITQNDVFFTLAVLTLPGVPVAAGLAILKYRLYDIDLVIRRTLVYGVLTATLVGAYLGLVLLLQLLFGPLTQGNDLAIAGSTLAVAALFGPARRRIQAAVDRRFYRRRYDAARTLEGFSARLREEVDLEALSGELRALVRETVQPAHVSLWLREAEP